MRSFLFSASVVLALSSSACGGQSPADTSGDDTAGTGGSTNAGGAPSYGTGGARDAGQPAKDAPVTQIDQVAPTPASQWVNVTNNLESEGGGCAKAAFITSKPDEDMLIVNLWQSGMWASKNGGDSWEKLGTGGGSDAVNNGTVSVVFDPASTTTFWESGMYGGAAFQTTDKGDTWKALGTIQHGEVMGVDFTDPARKVILVGAHEASQKLYRTNDGGATFDDVGPNLPAGSAFSSFPLVIDGQTHLVGCSGYGNNTPGIFRTTDGGQTWTKVSDKDANGGALLASDGAIYWPLIYNRGLVKSTDKGVTWTQPVSQWNIVTPMPPVELPDKRIAMLSGNGNNITPYIAVSADSGKTWKKATDPVPLVPRSFTYSAQRRAFYISYDDCTSQKKDAVMRFGFDYATQ
jgi:photosystem II stability/assembly factor-like uncharacterized protein